MPAVVAVVRFILTALHYEQQYYINSAVDTSQRWLLGHNAMTQRSMVPGAMTIINSQQKHKNRWQRYQVVCSPPGGQYLIFWHHIPLIYHNRLQLLHEQMEQMMRGKEMGLVVRRPAQLQRGPIKTIRKKTQENKNFKSQLNKTRERVGPQRIANHHLDRPSDLPPPPRSFNFTLIPICPEI